MKKHKSPRLGLLITLGVSIVFLITLNALSAKGDGNIYTSKINLYGRLDTPYEEDKSISFSDGNLSDSFDREEILEETGNMDRSSNLHWWVNSGAFLIVDDGVGKTLQGNLRDTKWVDAYVRYNSIDTDGGHHPQNIFRLVTRSKWQNFEQEAYFKIVRNNLSESSNRSASNGLLLFNRYQDADNLYYAGIRVDGAAVIKKKIRGEYFTIAYEPLFDGEYNRKSNPNLLPENTWLGLRSETKTINGDEVQIKLFIDKESDGNWQLILDVTDNGKSYGGAAILDAGHAGIRTDFMDVEFDNYRIKDIEEPSRL